MKNASAEQSVVEVLGITAVINRGLMKRRSEDTRYSHFAGTEGELKRATLFAWFEGKFRKSSLKLDDSTYIVTIPPDKSFCKSGARQITDRPDGSDPTPRWEKLPAEKAEVVVIVSRSLPTGAVCRLEIIDIQATPYQHKLKQHESEQRMRA